MNATFWVACALLFAAIVVGISGAVYVMRRARFREGRCQRCCLVGRHLDRGGSGRDALLLRSSLGHSLWSSCAEEVILLALSRATSPDCIGCDAAGNALLEMLIRRQRN